MKKYGQIRIRLEHSCGPGSLLLDSSCEPSDFNFKHYFSKYKVRRVTEFNIAGTTCNFFIFSQARTVFRVVKGNFPLKNRQRLHWKTKNGYHETEAPVRDFTVTLKRAELRTFVVQIVENKA